VEWLGQQMPALFLATGFCEDKELTILGLSLANWALAAFAACLAAAGWALWRSRRAGR
jgi:disulfide bond formation protein DsbB